MSVDVRWFRGKTARIVIVDSESGGWGLCEGRDGKLIFASRDDEDYRKVLQALRTGIEHRTGLAQLLLQRQQCRYSHDSSAK